MHDMKKLPDTKFGNRFSTLIAQSKYKTLNNGEIGKKFDVSGTMVHHYKHGNKLPSMETAILIANKLNCCVEYLLTGRGPIRIQRTDDSLLDVSDLDKSQKVAIQAVVNSFKDKKPDDEVI